MEEDQRINETVGFLDAWIEREKYHASGMVLVAVICAAMQRFVVGTQVYGADGIVLSFALFLLAATYFGWGASFAMSIKSRFLLSKAMNGAVMEISGPYQYAGKPFEWLSSAFIWVVFVTDPIQREYLVRPTEIHAVLVKIHNRGFVISSMAVVVFVGQLLTILWKSRS